jgi:subtilisin family serine protease
MAMRKNTVFLWLALTSSLASEAQLTRHIVSFRDKKATTLSLSQPSAFLTAKALERRRRYNIAIDSTDLPVCRAYLDTLASIRNVRVLNASRWLNQAAIQTTDASALARIRALPFVRAVESVAAVARPMDSTSLEPMARDALEELRQGATASHEATGVSYYNYGNSAGQVRIHEGDFLHDLGFRGEGMTIAVLDAGFQSYLGNRAFDSLRRSGRILGTWDFVAGEASVNEDDAHGANCLSVMASNLPGIMVGTAPAASYWLFRTEEVTTEYPVEEHFWAVGAERADSLGADMISSSLGYTDFDDPSLDHRYAQLDGNTTMVSRAADMAAKKGMIVTNSAGNSGAGAWKYIGAPADGDSVLAVGAVDVNGSIGAFSSFGPSADGQVKPDVASVGVRAFVITPNGVPAQGNGTSYANPNMAGLVACLWQAFPEFGNMEVIDALRRSSSRFANPDDRVGYGIPNLRKAYEDLLRRRQVRQARAILKDDYIRAFPSPFDRRLNIYYTPSSTGGRPAFEMVDGTGRTVLRHQATVGAGEILTLEMPGVEALPKGVWMLRYADGERQGVIRLVK